MRRILLAVLATVFLSIVVVGCGESGPPYEVTQTVVSGAETQDLTVWAPDADGTWPVVYAMPGSGGSAVRDLGVLAEELAKSGLVVFAADVFADSYDEMVQYSECGYRYSLQVAEDHGGDLARPVTMLGFSTGASGAVFLGLNSAGAYGPDGVYEVCPPAAERPDIVVSIAGCHYTLSNLEHELGSKPSVTANIDTTWNWDHKTAEILLVAGSEDRQCQPFQSIGAQETLQEDGFEVMYVGIEGAGHGELVFHDTDNDWAELPSDDPRGQAVAQVIIDTIEAAG